MEYSPRTLGGRGMNGVLAPHPRGTRDEWSTRPTLSGDEGFEYALDGHIYGQVSTRLLITEIKEYIFLQ